MKICYLIQTHKNPEQIYRLVKVIKQLSPDSYVLISHNYYTCDLDRIPIQNLPNVEVIISNKIQRYDFSILQAYFNAIDWLFQHNIKFDWLVNLTGQDYPTQPLPKIENFLAQTKYDGFLEYFDVFSPQSPWGLKTGCDRYCYQYLLSHVQLSREQKILFKLVKNFINYFQNIVKIDVSPVLMIACQSEISPFNEQFKCYGGSYFTTLSWKCIRYLHDLFIKSSKIISYYKNTLLPEESLIQTLLVNSNKFNLCDRNCRYINFKKSRHGHPHLLTLQDYPFLIQEDMHFARKFDIAKNSQILDLLDKRIFS
ncbi:N-acetylglucosaminyltransferase [Scytonema hofmannii PCC 7110]|uniref:Peptide O-xylosyltransferase n=1 Tax=Scytonema hofmannii PCC 7110 TaxID=128403 RepID=A0A139X3G1_9CYAN|nr:beta-1,6-N-acetylglucosaminyltransferase [Scytonema hofmannii]KYC39249.1 N-acetylglucosaminyltransferase [Scytonema hofmannii PCC 7110]